MTEQRVSDDQRILIPRNQLLEKECRIMRALMTIASSVVLAGNALASHDYYVYGEAYSPPGYQFAYILIDSLHGEVMVQPDNACGMQFEGDTTLTWTSVDGSMEEDFPIEDGISHVWLPSKDCSAWNAVTVEEEDGPLLGSPPNDFSGHIEVYAQGYWIDTDGDKVMYKSQPCHPMPGCMDAPDKEALGDGWSEGLIGSVAALRRVVAMFDVPSTASTPLIDHAANALAAATTETSGRTTHRRSTHTGSLEASLRQLEDAALWQLNSARAELQVCRQAVVRRNLPEARRSCELSLSKTLKARNALDMGDSWVE
jgi:hypothetical protein